MELQNADTLRWHVYEILTNDVPVSTAIGRDLIGVASCRVSSPRSDVYISRWLRRYWNWKRFTSLLMDPSPSPLVSIRCFYRLIVYRPATLNRVTITNPLSLPLPVIKLAKWNKSGRVSHNPRVPSWQITNASSRYTCSRSVQSSGWRWSSVGALPPRVSLINDYLRTSDLGQKLWKLFLFFFFALIYI